GVIMSVAETDTESQARIAAFRAGFEELWKESEKIRFEYRWTAGRVELATQYAREMVALAPVVILANGTPVIAALLQLTTSIPIVCALLNDRGARAAGASPAHRCAHAVRRRPSGRSGPPRGVRAGTATIGLDRRPQCADRLPLVRRRR